MASKKEVAEPLRRITVRSVLGVSPKDDDKLMKAVLSGQAVPLVRVLGITKAHKVKVTDLGESIAFIGQFKAESLYGENKGKFFTGSKCYLPQFLEEELHGLLTASGAVNGQPVTFAFEIGVKRDKESATGYQYTAKPLVEPEEGDAISLLEARVYGRALPAPKAAT
jgi:hypothetical protein